MENSTITLTVSLSDRDWKEATKSWDCSALRIPDARVARVLAEGKEIDTAEYKPELDIHSIRWTSSLPRPELIIVVVDIQKQLIAKDHSDRWRKRAITWPVAATVFVGIIGPLLTSALSPDDELIPCSSASEWPRGEWLISGKVTHGGNAALAPRVMFETPTSGTVQTDEAGSKVGEFSLTHEMSPRKRVESHTKDSTGYAATFRGVVSTNGCFITGNWDDSEGRKGYSTWFWRGRDRYWVGN